MIWIKTNKIIVILLILLVFQIRITNSSTNLFTIASIFIHKTKMTYFTILALTCSSKETTITRTIKVNINHSSKLIMLHPSNPKLSTYSARLSIKLSGVSGSGLRGGLSTWPAEWWKHSCFTREPSQPKAAARVSPYILLGLRLLCSSTVLAADLLITCTIYNGQST